MASPTEIRNMDNLHTEQRSELINLLDQQHMARSNTIFEERTANIHLNEQLVQAQAMIKEHVQRVQRVDAENSTLKDKLLRLHRLLSEEKGVSARLRGESITLREGISFREHMITTFRATINQNNEAIARYRRALDDMERTIIRTRVRGPTCGDNGGVCQNGTPCSRSIHPNSRGRCRDH